MKPASRSVLFGVSILLASWVLAGQVHAQTTFTRIQAFGDSYADTGNLWKITGGIGQFPLYPTGRFSGGTSWEFRN
jgi:outer membrane lipase/esterase